MLRWQRNSWTFLPQEAPRISFVITERINMDKGHTTTPTMPSNMGSIPARLSRILDAALEGSGPGKEDCCYLLSFPSESLEASMILAVADIMSRRRFRNRGVLLAQIGIETAPCPAGCKFCAFGEGHTTVETSETYTGMGWDCTSAST